MGLKTETPKLPLENLPEKHGPMEVGFSVFVTCQGVGKPLLAQHPETSVALYWPKKKKHCTDRFGGCVKRQGRLCF